MDSRDGLWAIARQQRRPQTCCQAPPFELVEQKLRPIRWLADVSPLQSSWNTHWLYVVYHSMTTNSRVGIEQVLLDGAHVVVLVPENRT